MNPKAIVVESLSLSIRGVPILRGISMQIEAGGVCSVIGSNGAGKSTLLKCLMGIQTGWVGRVWVDGRDLRRLSQRDLARQVAYVPQPGGDAPFPYTVREFVRMGRYAWGGLFGSAGPGDDEAIERSLERACVHGLAGRSLETLSGGERQKVHMAAALAQGGGVLLLDEPTAFLDYRHQAEVADVIRRLNRESGTTVLVVTHDVNAAIASGGFVVGLRDGQEVWSGPAGEVACERVLSRIYGIGFRFLDDPVTGLRLVLPQGPRGAA